MTEVLAEAQSERITRAISAATSEAMELGVFGSPTFVVDGEVFWGDDRLNDAVAWASGKLHQGAAASSYERVHLTLDGAVSAIPR